MPERYLFLTSNDSRELFPSNNSTNFTIELPSFLVGVNSVSLMEFHCETFLEPVFVFCDVVRSSHVKDSLLPVLRLISTIGEVSNSFPIASSRSDIIRLTFKIMSLDLTPPHYDLGTVRLVLKVTTDLQ